MQGQAAAGTSSFGMSGVNAHAVLCSAELQHAPEEQLGLPWQRLRHWFAPAQHALLSTCAKLGGTVAMVARLSTASLAYLQDHQVNWIVDSSCHDASFEWVIRHTSAALRAGIGSTIVVRLHVPSA